MIAEMIADLAATAEITADLAVIAEKELPEKEARSNYVNAEKSQVPSRSARKTEG